jgi:prenylcysteine oxidase / farnesylcysteine lyase
MILKNSSEAFGLKPKESSETDGGELLGIWDGKEFVYQQKDSGWYYWDIAKLLWKYGLAPYRTQKLVQSTVAKFRKLYEYPFFPFRSLSDRALDLELTPITSVTGEQFLAANKVSLTSCGFKQVLMISDWATLRQRHYPGQHSSQLRAKPQPHPWP